MIQNKSMNKEHWQGTVKNGTVKATRILSLFEKLKQVFSHFFSTFSPSAVISYKQACGSGALKWTTSHTRSKTSYNVMSNVYTRMIKLTRLPSSLFFWHMGGKPGNEARMIPGHLDGVVMRGWVVGDDPILV